MPFLNTFVTCLSGTVAAAAVSQNLAGKYHVTHLHEKANALGHSAYTFDVFR